MCCSSLVVGLKWSNSSLFVSVHLYFCSSATTSLNCTGHNTLYILPPEHKSLSAVSARTGEGRRGLNLCILSLPYRSRGTRWSRYLVTNACNELHMLWPIAGNGRQPTESKPNHRLRKLPNHVQTIRPIITLHL